jgi:hypothetical protein
LSAGGVRCVRPTGLEARSEFEKVAAPERPAVKSRLIAKFKDSLRARRAGWRHSKCCERSRQQHGFVARVELIANENELEQPAECRDSPTVSIA